MSPKTNSDFILAAVAEMVRCSDVEFTAFRKKKSSKKKVAREAKAISEVRAAPEGEAVLVMPISEVVGTGVEVFVILPEVPRDVDAAREPPNAPDAAKVADEVEAPGGEGSPIWAARES